MHLTNDDIISMCENEYVKTIEYIIQKKSDIICISKKECKSLH